MTEELEQKAIDFIRKTKGREYHIISDTYTDEQIERFYENEINLMIGFATEATKELKEENGKLLQRIEQLEKDVIENESDCSMCDFPKLKKDLEKQIEKMKCCENCIHHHFMGDELKCHLDYDTEFECLKTKQNWELAE